MTSTDELVPIYPHDNGCHLDEALKRAGSAWSVKLTLAVVFAQWAPDGAHLGLMVLFKLRVWAPDYVCVIP